MTHKYRYIYDKKIGLIKRTSYYVQKPYEYEIECDKCGGRNIEWSEWKGLVWCYDCEIDTPGTKGVFDGPIPIGVAGVLGMSFDRYDMANNRIVRFKDKEWDKI